MTALHVTSRVAASLLGGYAFVWGFTALGIAVGLATGAPYNEAQTLMHLLAFIVFLVCFCWSYVAASVLRVWLLLAGGGALMTGIAWLMTRTSA